MQVCSYTLECEEFDFDFVPKEKKKTATLHEKGSLYSYFTIPKSEKFYMKISYSANKFLKDMEEIRSVLWLKFIAATLLLLILALFFTFYSLQPIRKALQLNDEFIKDILHDFNTPITAMVLNLKMFQNESGENTFIKRISHSIDTLIFLQENLKNFLFHSPSQNKEVDIASLVEMCMEQMRHVYPKIIFEFEKENALSCESNADLIARIFDNLLSNAAKYNKSNGRVTVRLKGTEISIVDTGKGIQDVHKVMQRYYKEQERGLGLGLHIVKKLADELHIDFVLKSKPGEGTSAILDFKHLKEVHV